MAMIYATGHLSGAHINPAVTLAFVLTRHFPARDALTYVGAQLAGATAGALVLLAAWPSRPADLGATVPSVGVGPALLYETLLTAVLMFVIVSVATDTRAVGSAAALAIGGTVALDALFGGPVDRGLDEPGALRRPRPRGRTVGELLGLPGRAAPRGGARRTRLPARAGRGRP